MNSGRNQGVKLADLVGAPVHADTQQDGCYAVWVHDLSPSLVIGEIDPGAGSPLRCDTELDRDISDHASTQKFATCS